jgi:hypothetical protein
MIMFRAIPLLLLAAIPCAATDASPNPSPQPSTAITRTFKDVSVQQLRHDPERYVGTVFEERFVFSHIFWSRDRQRRGQPALDLPTHFTARIVASPAYVARIEFPPAADSVFEPMRDGTTVRLRVRFLRLHPANRSPVFAFEKLLPNPPPSSDLDYLRR